MITLRRDQAPNPTRQPLTERFGGFVLDILGKYPDTRTPNQKRRLGSAVFLTATSLVAVVSSLVVHERSSAPEHIPAATCAAKELDANSTFAQAMVEVEDCPGGMDLNGPGLLTAAEDALAIARDN